MRNPADRERTPDRAEKGYLFLAGIFLGALVLTNLIAGRFFFLFGNALSVSLLAYPVTFLATDLVSEIYGKKRASQLVKTGFLVSIFVTAVVWLALHTEPATTDDGSPIGIPDPYFQTVFGLTPAIVFGSMIAYLTAQFVDVYMFHFWFRLTKGKHLWLRNNASTVVSQLVDTTLVVTISLVIWPKMVPDGVIQPISFETWKELVITSYLFKAAVALIDTPLFYLGTYWYRNWVSQDPSRH
ncbi:MAG: VUT family protein [Planctomycetota bacterium]|nr:MAG: VUT family protein [Planctomycetota bacterium]